MRAAVIGPDASFQVDTLSDPTPGPGELVLRVTACGICGSDLKARPVMPPGTVMGHELCGEVVAVGEGATDAWAEGMRAAVLPVQSCGSCAWCRSGNVAHCASASLLGLTVRFSVYYRPKEFRTVIDAFVTERIDPAPLVTRTVGLADLDDAFASLETSPADLKVVVDPAAGVGPSEADPPPHDAHDVPRPHPRRQEDT